MRQLGKRTAFDPVAMLREEFRRRTSLPATLNVSVNPALWELMSEKPSSILPGTVEKIIEAPISKRARKSTENR